MPELTPLQLDILAMTMHQPLVVPHEDIAYFFDTTARVRIATFRRLRDLRLIEPEQEEDAFWRPSTAGRELLQDHRDRVASTGRAHGVATARIEVARRQARDEVKQRQPEA